MKKDKDPVRRAQIKLKRLVYAHRAFKNAIAMCEFLETQSITEEVLWYRTAVTGLCTEYMRPFLHSDGIGHLPDEYQRFDDPDMLSMHNHLKYGRHWIFAHHDAVQAPQLLRDEDKAVYHRIKVVSLGERKFVCTTLPVKFSTENIPVTKKLCELQRQRVNADTHDTIQFLIGTKEYPPGEYILGETFP